MNYVSERIENYISHGFVESVFFWYCVDSVSRKRRLALRHTRKELLLDMTPPLERLSARTSSNHHDLVATRSSNKPLQLRAIARRTFATEEAMSPFEDLEKSGKKHNPLIQLFGTPAKFATAAYRQASQANALDQVEKDLTVRLFH